MKLYLIPGLGVNYRLFEKQVDLGIDVEIIEWKRPLETESLQEYAFRMSAAIKEDDFYLGGVSMGGVVAAEVAKFKKPQKLFIISSIKSSCELPPHLKILRLVPVYKLIPFSLYKNLNTVSKLLLPAMGRLTVEEKKVFAEMLKGADPYFVKWAIDKIINWKCECKPENFVHIHGSSDIVFPDFFIKKPFVKILKGSHLMVMTMSDAVNKIIKEEVVTINSLKKTV